MGGPADPTLTLESKRRSQTHEERRTSFERLLLIGCFAWPPFAVIDVLGAKLLHLEQAIPLLLALRGIGTVIIVVLYAAVRWGNLTPLGLTLLDYLSMLLAGAFVSAMGLVQGGLASPQYAGSCSSWSRGPRSCPRTGSGPSRPREPGP
jgi:hypothetical protein